jgi:hypothetical protein
MSDRNIMPLFEEPGVLKHCRRAPEAIVHFWSQSLLSTGESHAVDNFPCCV